MKSKRSNKSKKTNRSNAHEKQKDRHFGKQLNTRKDRHSRNVLSHQTSRKVTYIVRK